MYNNKACGPDHITVRTWCINIYDLWVGQSMVPHPPSLLLTLAKTGPWLLVNWEELLNDDGGRLVTSGLSHTSANQLYSRKKERFRITGCSVELMDWSDLLLYLKTYIYKHIQYVKWTCKYVNALKKGHQACVWFVTWHEMVISILFLYQFKYVCYSS